MNSREMSTAPRPNNNGSSYSADDIVAAANLAFRVKSKDVELNAVFKRKLIVNSGLDKIKSNGSDQRSDVLRKNIYLLARQTKNVKGLVIQFTQRGIISLDENEIILDKEKDLLCAVCLYSTLITKESNNFEAVLELLRVFENAHVAQILESNGGENVLSQGRGRAGRIPPQLPPQPQRPGSNPPPRPPAPKRPLDPAWTCPHCTYKNPVGSGKACTMCAKTAGSSTDAFEDPIAGKDVQACKSCTFMNPAKSDFCEVCVSPLRDEVFVSPIFLPRPVTDSDSDSD